ncbi:Mag2 protein [Candida orthopsilosis Co 90-125]|uniref:Mag2 protein n=1 Tax=Candida orthopsilosis (strain 90-125) TaxID=1136231 RepID=H8X7Q3_CANO9|nr:Mag2 protein [Candida orthopsilosis Co 90-125]CCG23838.1 Mag2 protein [Candida orthopsilosis Co 90-125]
MTSLPPFDNPMTDNKNKFTGSGSKTPTLQQQQQQNFNKRTNGKRAQNNRSKSRKFDHRNDNELTSLESPLTQGRKVNGNSRKNQISINHLLDFQSYRDTEQYAMNHQRDRARRRSSSHKKNQPVKVQLAGMKYINVNFKFVVDSRLDYKVQQLDPNVPIDVTNIMSIIAPKASCPICLTDDIIAPRMIVSCGHILCLKCVLSLLEHEVPKAKKRESAAIVEKYRECPLCFSIIRKNELKPVIIRYIDEQFEVPKVRDETVLTLMMRDSHKILSMPKAIAVSNHVTDFPDINQTDLTSYSRIFKGDHNYMTSMYEVEKAQIVANHEEEKELYGDDSALVQQALSHIDQEVADWTSRLAAPLKKDHKHAHHYDDASLPLPLHQTFYYYETGFNAGCTYVLSPLDMKVLKATYSNYESLPTSIVAKIENIRYEELSQETSMTKYKYLSHLPIGTQIGFLECDWNNNEYVSQPIWDMYKNDLVKRSKNSSKRFLREERNRKRAESEEEFRLRQFYMEENGFTSEDLANGKGSFSSYDISNRFASLSVNGGPMPPLSDNPLSTESENDNNVNDEAENENAVDDDENDAYVTTVWGTRIKKSQDVNNLPEIAIEDEWDDWDADGLIRKAREENNENDGGNDVSGNGGIGHGKKKKKKKLILMSS